MTEDEIQELRASINKIEDEFIIFAKVYIILRSWPTQREDKFVTENTIGDLLEVDSYRLFHRKGNLLIATNNKPDKWRVNLSNTLPLDLRLAEIPELVDIMAAYPMHPNATKRVYSDEK